MRRAIGLPGAATIVLAALGVAAGPRALAQLGAADGPTGRWQFGVLSASTEAVSEQGAREFLAENAGLVGLTAGTEDLVLVRDFRSPIGRHFVFAQRFQGVPVHTAEVKVHYDKAGRVIGVNSSYVPGIALDSIRPAVPLERALEAIAATGPTAAPARAADLPARAERLRQALPGARGSLVIHVVDGSARLAWRVVAPSRHETWEAFVDALSGETLRAARDINRYATGTGQVFRVNAVVATRDNSLRDNNDSASAVPASAYSLVTLLGLDGNGFLDGIFASSRRTKKRAFNASNSFVFDRSNDGFSETMGYYSFDYAERYIQSLGFSNVNNRQQVFSVNRFKPDNSFYSTNSQEITLGLGGVDDAEDGDVIWHEYGHSIQDNQVPGFGSTLEAGSMGEGFGDYWAGTLGAQLSGGFQDACIAEWDATSYSSTMPPCLRRLDGTKHYPDSVVGEVHADGEIWSAALWQIRGAIGAARADRLVLQHHFLISAGASFNEAADALVTTAINLGYRTPEVKAIRTILGNRGFTVTV